MLFLVSHWIPTTAFLPVLPSGSGLSRRSAGDGSRNDPAFPPRGLRDAKCFSVVSGLVFIRAL